MRLFNKEPWLGKAYKEIILHDVAARADFIRRSRGMGPQVMKALMKTILTDKVSCRRVRKRSKTISYVDIHDLKKHFKGKPEFSTMLSIRAPSSRAHTQGLICMPSILSNRITPILIL